MIKAECCERRGEGVAGDRNEMIILLSRAEDEEDGTETEVKIDKRNIRVRCVNPKPNPTLSLALTLTLTVVLMQSPLKVSTSFITSCLCVHHELCTSHYDHQSTQRPLKVRVRVKGQG